MFDWRDNLELARTLGTGTPGETVAIRASETTDRCAVGRAYYAAFCHARSFAVQHLGFAVTGGAGDYGRLVRHFQNHGHAMLAFHLNQLRQWRNQCDYDDVVPNHAQKVHDALREAEAVIRRL